MAYVLSAPETSKVPIAPMEVHMFRVLCLQGGGVYVQDGTVTFVACTISGNTATVRAHVQNFPDGKIADVLASTRLHN